MSFQDVGRPGARRSSSNNNYATQSLTGLSTGGFGVGENSSNENKSAFSGSAATISHGILQYQVWKYSHFSSDFLQIIMFLFEEWG